MCTRIVVTERVYLVPRPDGRLIVGATVEERGFDVQVTAGGVHELLREAYRALPEIAELELVGDARRTTPRHAGQRPADRPRRARRAGPRHRPLPQRRPPRADDGGGGGRAPRGAGAAPETEIAHPGRFAGQSAPGLATAPGSMRRPGDRSSSTAARRSFPRERRSPTRSRRPARTAAAAGSPWRSTARWFAGRIGGRPSSRSARRSRSSGRCRVARRQAESGGRQATDGGRQAEPSPLGGAELELGGRIWGSRLIVGTGGFRSLETMERALVASGAEIVTVALRRVDPTTSGSALERHRPPRPVRAARTPPAATRRATRSAPRAWRGRRSRPIGSSSR